MTADDNLCLHLHSTVSETRRIGAEIYRRRYCRICFKHFVSLETAPEGLKMPYDAGAAERVRRSRLRAAQQAPVQIAWEHNKARDK